MQATDLANTQTIDTVLRILTWLVIGFTGLWLVTGVVGYLHRRAYNLTRAESGGSKPITPDFLKVDKKKRQAAIDRGESYDEVLEKRQALAARSPAEKIGVWSRAGATISASFTLVAAVVGTLTKVDALQKGAGDLSSWDRLSNIVQQHKVGTVIAVIVIGANVLVFVNATKKTLAKS